MPADHDEEPADEALGRPVRETDAAAGAHHADELLRGAAVVGGEHDAEYRGRDVERGVGERQVLGVGDLQIQRQSFRRGAPADRLQQRRDVVGRCHDRKAPGCGERGVAVSGGDVEHALAGAQVDRLAEALADDLQRGSHHGVMPAAQVARWRALNAPRSGADVVSVRTVSMEGMAFLLPIREGLKMRSCDLGRYRASAVF